MHEVRFCEIWLNKDGSICIYINDVSASTYDNLLIKIKGDKYNSQYWTSYIMGDDRGLIWKTIKQELILKKFPEKAGDVVMGFVDFKCEVVDTKRIKTVKKHTISLCGYFNAMVGDVVPDGIL